MQFSVLCNFYLCDNTMSQTPPSRVGSGHETTYVEEELSALRAEK